MQLTERGHPRRRSLQPGWWCLTVAFGTACWLILGSAEGYRFFNDGRLEGRRVVEAEYARPWHPEIWPPGETLTWVVANDPGWTSDWTDEGGVTHPAPLADPAEVVPFVARALQAWSDIESADIRWEVSGVDDSLERPEWDDGHPTIFVDPGATRGSYAAVFSKRIGDSDRWGISDCHVPLSPAAASELGEEPWWDHVLIHEFGHCLGLAHAGALSVAVRHTGRPGRDASWVHPPDPLMSYGFYKFPPVPLEADDVVGASLLRPAGGWLRSTGSIAGSVTLDSEEPPAHAHVWALPLGPNPLRDRVGVFSSAEGEFRIEGLDPGDYALWVQPPYKLDAHGGFRDFAILDLDETVVGRLVRVRAGRTTDGLQIPLRSGRTSRRPPGASAATQESGPLIPITERWGTPCTGIRVRGARPFPPDGPLWFAPREERTGGDRWFGTVLTVELSPASSFDWVGPYRDWTWDWEEERFRPFVEFATEDWFPNSSVLDVSVTDWRIEPAGSLVRHVMDIAWPEATEATIRFRSEDDSCDGEPLVVCDLSGCAIRLAG